MPRAHQDERVVLVPAAHVEGVERVVLDGEDGAGVSGGGGRGEGEVGPGMREMMPVTVSRKESVWEGC